MTKKLYRSQTDVKISGVCGGIGEYTNVDTTIIRLLWVLGTLFSGGVLGIIMYIVCALVIPKESDLIEGEYKEKE
jgi:phage shock protein C